MASYAHFEIDIVSALSSQMVAAFSNLDIAPLTTTQIDPLPKGQGIYKLYHSGVLVYVGKADSLRKRLLEHHEKIRGRRNIEIAEMGFNCLFVHPNWTTLAPENSLINHYRVAGEGKCAWNGNGFGPHDPGRDRETTDKPPEGFDALYPIREDWICDWISSGEYNAGELLGMIKGGLPYLLRYQTARKKSREPHPDYRDLKVSVPRDGMTAYELLRVIAQLLPGWQGTCFPSHMILYKERRAYVHGKVVWP